jgi:hypothetical protein
LGVMLFTRNRRGTVLTAGEAHHRRSPGLPRLSLAGGDLPLAG